MTHRILRRALTLAGGVLALGTLGACASNGGMGDFGGLGDLASQGGLGDFGGLLGGEDEAEAPPPRDDRYSRPDRRDDPRNPQYRDPYGRSKAPFDPNGRLDRNDQDGIDSDGDGYDQDWN